MCFGSKVVDTTTKQELPAWLEDEAKRITQMTAGITDMNAQYVPYGGERLAGLTTEQQMARQGAVQQAQAYRPDLQASRALTTMGAQPITAENISQYQNPYSQAVMQTTLDELERRQQIADQGMADRAVKSGAYGGARFGVQQAESERNLRDIQAKAAADIQAKSYQQALAAAQADKQRQGQAGQAYGNIAGQEMQLGGAGLSGLYQAGQLGQTQAQAGRDIAYEDFQRQQQFPYAQAQYAAGILGGMPQPMTTYSQQPTAGTGQRLLGLGIAGIGAAGQAGMSMPNFFSDVRLKDNVKLVGKSPSNINIYSFNYKGSKDKYEGVLAQEVLWASTEHDNGYLMVDYSKLDVDFRRLN
jgi:hypothetical protein